MKNYPFILFLSLLISACSLLQTPLEKTTRIPYSFTDIDLESEEVKYINVIFQVFNDSLGKGNFQDTAPDIDWLKFQIELANRFLSNIEEPKPLVGNYIKDTKIRLRLVDIKFWNSANGSKATVHGKYSHKDLYREYVLENDSLTEFERNHCVHLLLSGVVPRAYGGRNICMQRGCKDGFGFQNNVLYFEGMYQVYNNTFNIWGVGTHIMHEVGHGLGLGHYDRNYGPCTSCSDVKPCPDDCRNFMKTNNGGDQATECQIKLMHHMLKYGPIDSTMLNPNSKAHLLIEDLPEDYQGQTDLERL